MGSGISLPAQLFKKQLKVTIEQYEPPHKEAPGIRGQKRFDWSQKLKQKRFTKHQHEKHNNERGDM